MKPHLLIVEDNHSLRQMLVWEFEELEYQVTAAPDCRQARKHASARRFDLALVDYHLPDGSGMHLSAELRRRYPEIFVVVVSGLPCRETEALSADRGQVRFVPKPASASRLHRTFQESLPQ
jgi:DNA-binding response OmpR family regulator